MSEQEWDLMDALLRIRMEEKGYDIPGQPYGFTREQILAFCDSHATAQALLSSVERYSNPKNWGFWARLANWLSPK
ncbi:MAG: hypothetical protein JSS84_01950 [Bacteroidetes bacterium]|nr:hypothetical protein [Bacteroidota bacterium]